MNLQNELEGSVPKPNANISAGMELDVNATERAARLVSRFVNGIFAEHRKAQRVEKLATSEEVIAQQVSPLQFANPEAIVTIAGALTRIADHFNPPAPDIVDSVYVSQKLGCTTTWIADLARNSRIPASCLVPGTGDGKPWKFYRAKIETWITEQR